MALIQFENTEDSFRAISEMHNKPLLGRKIQISFTKSKLYWSYLSFFINYRQYLTSVQKVYVGLIFEARSHIQTFEYRISNHIIRILIVIINKICVKFIILYELLHSLAVLSNRFLWRLVILWMERTKKWEISSGHPSPACQELNKDK
jgi:RNA recognition motif-containing protein